MGVGGSPSKSSFNRRSKVPRSDSGDGVNPACSSFARTKESMEEFTQAFVFVFGGTGVEIGRKDQ